MSIRIRASLNCPKSTVLLSSSCFKSRLQVVTNPHKSFASYWKIYPHICFFNVAQPLSISLSKRISWSIRSSADANGLDSPPGNNLNGGTRLIRSIQNLQVKLNTRIQESKKGFPTKVLFFLMGIYCSTAFSTVIGQTGDWDILCAGLAVIVVEVIGALMYKTSFPLVSKIRRLITMFNYWKAGLSLGLFLDAFKYEIDDIFGLPKPFDFDLDVFRVFS